MWTEWNNTILEGWYDTLEELHEGICHLVWTSLDSFISCQRWTWRCGPNGKQRTKSCWIISEFVNKSEQIWICAQKLMVVSLLALKTMLSIYIITLQDLEKWVSTEQKEKWDHQEYSHKPQSASVTGQLYVWAALTRGTMVPWGLPCEYEGDSQIPGASVLYREFSVSDWYNTFP